MNGEVYQNYAGYHSTTIPLQIIFGWVFNLVVLKKCLKSGFSLTWVCLNIPKY